MMLPRTTLRLAGPALAVTLLVPVAPAHAQSPAESGPALDAPSVSAARGDARSSDYFIFLKGKPGKAGDRGHRVAISVVNCVPYGAKTKRQLRNFRRIKFNDGTGNWNNRVSAIEVPRKCQVKLFGRKQFRGQHTKWIGTTHRLGRLPTGWNNAATSMKVRMKPRFA